MQFEAWFIFALTGREPPTLLFFDSEAEKTLAWSYIGVPESGSVQAYLEAEKPAYGIWSFPELKGALFSVRPD